MSQNKYQLKGLSAIAKTSTALAAGLGILISSSGAIANTVTQINQSRTVIAQINPTTGGDIIIDPVPGNPGTTTTNPGTTTTTTASDTRFTCERVNGQYTVMYHPDNQGQSFAWATPSALGGGWTPEKRCSEISRRLESYRPDGLVEMKTGVVNNLNTICVTTQAVPGCRIVLTVPPGQDPQLTRDRVFQNLTVAESGQQTEGVNTFAGGDSLGQLLNLGRSRGIVGKGRTPAAINLRPFLSPSDGGTGVRLQSTPRSIPGRSTPRLFR